MINIPKSTDGKQRVLSLSYGKDMNIEPYQSAPDMKWYKLDESQIKEILKERFGENSDVCISVEEERKLVGGRGMINEKRVIVYHVTADVFTYISYEDAFDGKLVKNGTAN